MALSGLRWLTAAAACCALVWFGTLFRLSDQRTAPPDDGVRRSWTYRGSPAVVVEGRLAQVNDRLRTLEVRDSVLSVAKRSNDGALTLLVDPRIGEPMRQNMSAAVARQWTALGNPKGTRTIVALVIDTIRTPHGFPRTRGFMLGMPIDIFLPSAETNAACVAVGALHTWPASANYARINARLLAARETIASLLSPCAFYAAFGAPSPSIQRWLNDVRWTPARLADWNEASSSWQLALNNPPLPNARGVRDDATDRLRWFISPPGQACVAGERGTCARVLFEPHHLGIDSAWRANVVTSSSNDATNFYYMAGATLLGPAEGSILSEMVRTLGRDRFQQFWHSSLPAADALTQAGGEDADSWTRAWARRMYGPMTIEPRVTSNGFVAGILFIVLALAGSGYIGARRRVA